MVSLDTEVTKLLKRNIRMGKKICYKYIAACEEMFVKWGHIVSNCQQLTQPRSNLPLKQRLQVFGDICLWG